MKKWLIKKVTLPLWEWGSGRNKIKFYNQLLKSQFWPEKQIKELVDTKLQNLIVHAYSNVPYYRELFDKHKISPEDIKTEKDLVKIPILTKDLVNNNYDKLKAKNIDSYKHTEYTTGGTSGSHFKFINSQDTFDAHMAATLRGWNWMGWDFGDKYLYLWGASIDMKDEKKLKSKIRDAFTDNRMFMQAMMMTQSSLARDVEKIMKFKPDFIITYPSALVILTKYMESKNIKLKLKGISTTSEKLFDWQRKLFENFYGCKVTDDYGGRESSIKAIQCENGKYHISTENGILETVRNNKQVIGEMGKVILTEFNNYAMPLIRYENTDVATKSNKKCVCGRNLPILSEIQGRTSDIFVTADGRYLPAQYFMVALMGMPGEEYQVVQENLKEITIYVVKGKDFKEKDMKKIKEELPKWLGKETKIHVNYVKSIKKSASGKRRYFYSKVKPEF